MKEMSSEEEISESLTGKPCFESTTRQIKLFLFTLQCEKVRKPFSFQDNRGWKTSNNENTVYNLPR